MDDTEPILGPLARELRGFSRRLAALEVRGDGDLVRRLDRLEARLDRLCTFVESVGPASERARLIPTIEEVERKAGEQGHVLGPWTHPAKGPSFTKCKGCDATLSVAAGKLAAVDAATRRCTAKPVAASKPKPAPVRELRPRLEGYRYRERDCARCGESFQPSGPRSLYCRRPECDARAA